MKILFVTLLCLSTLAQLETPLTLGDPPSPHSLPDGGYAYYSVQVPAQSESGKEYLIFETSGIGEGVVDPNLYIATFSGPNRTHYEWKCTSLGKDVCVVPKQFVNSGKILHISVHCKEQCMYTVSAQLNAEVILKEDTLLSDQLRAGGSRMFKVKSDQLQGAAGDKDQSISIVLSFLGVNSNQVKMYVSKDNHPPSSENTLRVNPTLTGFIFKVYKSEVNEFCTNCSYLVLITTEVPLSYSLKYTRSKEYTKIYEQQFHIYEVVKKNERNCYEYQVKGTDQTLQVLINTYSGDPNIRVNPASLPDNPQNFQYYSDGPLDEQLSVGDSVTNVAMPGKYYICIYSQIDSAYALSIYTEKVDKKAVLPLHSGMTRTMQINAQEFQVFSHDMLVPRLTNVSFFLVSYTGNADLYVKFCTIELDEDDKEITPCELTAENREDKSVFKSKLLTSVDKIRLTYYPSEGNKREIHRFLVGVYGKKKSKFALTIIDQDQTEVVLQEGVPTIGSVGLYQFAYYKFFVEDPDTLKVKIQLTSISGDADLYISRVDPRCGCTLHQRTSNQEGALPDFISFEKGKDGFLNSSYFVSVHGYTQSSFTIQYSIETLKSPKKALRLFDGVPQSGTIPADENSILYFFEMPKDSRLNFTDIRIILTPISGQFMTFFGLGYVPTSSSYSKKLRTYESSMSIKIPYILSHGKHYILIEKNDQTDESTHLFNIKYYTGQFSVAVIEGFPEFNNISSGDVSYYYYVFRPEQEDVTISVTPYSGDPDLYVSISSNNTLPHLNKYDYESAKFGADSIYIRRQEFLSRNPNCLRSPVSLKENCGIYIGVVCITEECSFSLNINSAKTKKILVDGVPQFGTISNRSPDYYSFRPTANRSVTISVRQKIGPISVFVKLSPFHNLTSEFMPSKINYDYFLEENLGLHKALIGANKIEKCGHFCTIFIGVYSQSNSSSAPSYSITASTLLITSLIEGETHIDTVEDKTYNYYSFRVPCSDCTLSLSLTPLSSGDPDLFVNKGRDSFPTAQKSDFSAATFRGDFLQINPSDPFFKNHSLEFIGWYTIGVHGYQNCTYSLMVSTSHSLVKEISPNHRVKFIQRAGIIQYYSFYSWKKADIQLVLSVHYGRAIIRANLIRNIREVNLIDKLPASEESSSWSSYRTNTNNFLTIRKGDYYEYGVFVFGIEAIEDIDYELNMQYVTAEDAQILKIGESQLLRMATKDIKRFYFLISSFNKIDIRLTTFYGSFRAYVSLNSSFIPDIQIYTGRLVLEPEAPYFRLGKYYLSLEAENDCELTLVINQEATMQHLLEGLPTSSELIPNQPKYFLYSIPPQNLKDPKNLKLNVFVQFKEAVEEPVLYLRYISKQDNQLPSPSLHDSQFVWDSDLRQLGGSINVNHRNSKEIALSVSDEFGEGFEGAREKFSIVAWTTGTALLVPGHQLEGTLKNPGDYITYEVSIPKVTRMFIEVIPCIGEVEFNVTQVRQTMFDPRHYLLRATELKNGKIYGYLDAPSGTYYINVKAVGNSKTFDESKFTIRAILSSANEKADDLSDLRLENFGIIQFSLSGDQVNLDWGKVSHRSNGRYEIVDARFSVYMSEDPATNFQTICGIKSSNHKIIATNIKENSFQYTVKSKSQDRPLAFNVIAFVPEYDQSVAYQAVFFQIHSTRSVPRFYFISSIIVILLLLALVFYFCLKYRATQKILEYEMSDVRNMTQISSVSEVTITQPSHFAHLTTGSN